MMLSDEEDGRGGGGWVEDEVHSLLEAIVSLLLEFATWGLGDWKCSGAA